MKESERWQSQHEKQYIKGIATGALLIGGRQPNLPPQQMITNYINNLRMRKRNNTLGAIEYEKVLRFARFYKNKLEIKGGEKCW